MRLIDKVFAQRDFYIEHEGLSRRFLVRTASDFHDKLHATSLRFVLDRSATTFCTEFAAKDAKTVSACIDITRPPAERFWIEWLDRARVDTLASLTPVFKNRDKVPLDLRAGALIECAPGAPSGVAWLFSESGEEVDLCPLQVEFDLSQPMVAPPLQGLLSSFSVRSAEFPSLDRINQHALFTVEPSWREYVRDASLHPHVFNRMIHDLAGKMMFDFPLIASFILLYQAPELLKTQTTDFSRLNAARQRRGKPQLLDHLVVSASLRRSRAELSVDGRTNPSGSPGKRLHHVRGHFVRRGGAIFWRSPHLRGSIALGAIKSRTVNVTA